LVTAVAVSFLVRLHLSFLQAVIVELAPSWN
jgi:hypothetical protein